MKRILIVDDDVRLLSTLRKTLEAAGLYEVTTEDSGQRALAAAATFKPDLVILDVMMPGMDGGDVAHAIQTQPATRNVPILFLTSLVSKRDVTANKGRTSGEHYLAKPVDPKELCDRVAELVRQSEERDKEHA
jgi:CheY-like chemotaxis protein